MVSRFPIYQNLVDADVKQRSLGMVVESLNAVSDLEGLEWKLGTGIQEGMEIEMAWRVWQEGPVGEWAALSPIYLVLLT